MATANLTADGSTDAFQLESVVVPYHAGPLPEVQVFARGTFGGGTLTFDLSDDGSTWIDSGITGLTDDGLATLSVHPDTQFRATLAGATSPDLNIIFLS